MESWEWVYHGVVLSVITGSTVTLSTHCRGQDAPQSILISRLSLLCSAVMLCAPLIITSDSIFAMMRLWCWGLFVYGALWLSVITLVTWKTRRRFASMCALSATVIIIAGIDAFFIEPSWLQVTTYELRSPRIKRKVRVALVADLQTDHITMWERSVLSRMMEARPDLILIAGDTLQLRAEDRAEERAALRAVWREVQVQAPMGVIAVGGNTDTADWPLIYQGLGVDVIESTRSVDLNAVVVTGLSELESFSAHTRVKRPDDRYHIVVGHSPDFALGEIDADLLVAGHTHGGQVQIPFLGPLITFAQIPREWAEGETRLSKGQTLIVSRGIGMERGDAPRLRFWCRPQLVLIDINPATKNTLD